MPVAPLLATPVLAKTMRKSPKRWTIQSFVDFFHRFATWGSMVWYGNCMEHDQSFVYIYGHWCLWMVYPNSAIWRWIVASWRSQDANFRDIFWSPKKHKKIHVCDIFFKKSYFINRYLVILVSSTRFSVEFPWDGLGKCSCNLKNFKIFAFWNQGWDILVSIVYCVLESQWYRPMRIPKLWRLAMAHHVAHHERPAPVRDAWPNHNLNCWTWMKILKKKYQAGCCSQVFRFGTRLRYMVENCWNTDWHRFCKEMSRMSCPNIYRSINIYVYIYIYLHIT